MIELDFEQIEQVQKDLKRLSQELQDKAIKSGLTRAVGPVKKDMKSGAPQDSGDLSKSITARQITKKQLANLGPRYAGMLVSDSGIAILVGPNKKVRGYSQSYKALLVEEGVPAHEITPRRSNEKQVLKMRNRGSGFFFARGSINHPGSKANPFMARALQQNESQLTPRFYQGLAKRLDKLKAQ